MHAWQQGAARFSRANEQLMHGLTAAAQMQVALGQELLQRRLSVFSNLQIGDKPATVLNGRFEKTSEEADHLVKGIRKISDEIRLSAFSVRLGSRECSSFTEATRILFETVAPEEHSPVAAAVRKTDFSAARKTAHSAEART